MRNRLVNAYTIFKATKAFNQAKVTYNKVAPFVKRGTTIALTATTTTVVLSHFALQDRKKSTHSGYTVLKVARQVEDVAPYSLDIIYFLTLNLMLNKCLPRQLDIIATLALAYVWFSEAQLSKTERYKDKPTPLMPYITKYSTSVLSFPSTFLTTPTGATSQIPFDQNVMIANLNILNDDKLPLSQAGLCFGATTLWGQYENKQPGSGSELIKKINNLSKETKLALSDDLNFMYQRQKEQMGRQISTITLNDKINPMKEMTDLITVAIQTSTENPSVLYGITINGEKDAHIIGLMSQKQADSFSIKYFDSNFREATFDNVADANKGMLELIQYAYLNQFINKPYSGSKPKTSGMALLELPCSAEECRQCAQSLSASPV